MIEGKYVSQMREITPVDGNFSFGSTRMHFGLGDADIIDTLIIRWPSGHVDEYPDVKANQYYRAIENDRLEIDFKATNYIEFSPVIPDTVFKTEDESITFDLNDFFHFVKGDTIPEITGDTLTYDVIYIEKPDVVSASLNGNTLILESETENGDSEIQIVADAGFTKRMETFTISRIVGINSNSAEFGLALYPNPIINTTFIEYELKQPAKVQITIYNQLGKQFELIEKKQFAGKQRIVWDAKGLPSGVYFCVLKTEYGTQTMKMIKMK
jgi:hypothetical protein